MKRKGCPKVNPNHTRSIQQALKGKSNKKIRGDTKNLTHPHLEPNQSQKSIKGKGPSTIYNLVQYQKLHTKEFFILCIESSSLSKIILSLSFHTTQKRHNGASIQAFLPFLPQRTHANQVELP